VRSYFKKAKININSALNGFCYFPAAAAILIFRGELALFLGLFLIMDLIVGRVTVVRTFLYGVISLVSRYLCSR
jgi:hypothetical protein